MTTVSLFRNTLVKAAVQARQGIDNNFFLCQSAKKLSTLEASLILGISRKELLALIDNNMITAHKAGSYYELDIVDVYSFLRKTLS